ncbi:MAG: 50S ribosomal protein L11 methyltransferase [Bdellovibrionota bacterium]
MNENLITYFRVRLSQVPASLEDIVTTHSFEAGASGVSEALVFQQPNLTYDPTIIPVRSHEMDVFFPTKPESFFFEGLTKLTAQIRWQIFEEENKDWMAEWKKGFKPFQLVGPYWVVPSWMEVPAEAKIPLIIDPGMAFGTGTHATTQMAAYFVHKFTQTTKKDLSLLSVLDVGTGTAILALLAAKAGVKKIIGLEIDPEARRVARENIQSNSCPWIEIPETPLEETRQVFDVVIANIIDGVLLQLKDDLLRVLSPAGDLFLTGILSEKDSDFFAEFIEDSPLQVVRRLEKDEWVGYWLRYRNETETTSSREN